MKRGRNDNTSKGFKAMMRKPTETADPSKRKLNDSELTVRNLHRTKLSPLNVDYSCIAWAVCRATGSGIRIYP